jgi:hypothetical protein
MSTNKFRYIIFPDGVYQVTVDDYDGEPYTFEITGEEIAQHFRREKLLDRQLEDMYNSDQEENDGSQKHY